MTCNLCGNNETFWQEAEEASIQSLRQRIALWDGIYDEILLKKEKIAVAL